MNDSLTGLFWKSNILFAHPTGSNLVLGFSCQHKLVDIVSRVSINQIDWDYRLWQMGVFFSPAGSRQFGTECAVSTGGYPENTIRWTNVVLILGQRRRRWPNIEAIMVQRIVFIGQTCVLPCKTKRHYLLTSQVGIYCLLVLLSSRHCRQFGSICEHRGMNCCWW